MNRDPMKVDYYDVLVSALAQQLARMPPGDRRLLLAVFPPAAVALGTWLGFALGAWGWSSWWVYGVSGALALAVLVLDRAGERVRVGVPLTSCPVCGELIGHRDSCPARSICRACGEDGGHRDGCPFGGSVQPPSAS